MRLLGARLVMIVMATVAVIVLSSPGSAWGLQWTTLPQVPSTTNLIAASNSCTVGQCLNVGKYNLNGGPAFAMSWTNSDWSFGGPEATPNPAGATASQLDGVSCASYPTCTAVGQYTNGSGTKLSLAMRWNGSTWTIQTTPNPAGATISHLNSVSCTASNACTAVGDATVSGVQQALAMRWNGTTWAIQTTPTPVGATASQLDDVYCTSATACTAVGMYTFFGGTKMSLAMVWNGATWTVQTTPNPAGATISHLGSVSCTASNACTAVGEATISGSLRTLAMRWNGTAWTLQTTPNPASSTLHLKGVSCTSATACIAVGDSATSSPLILTWNGTTWSIQASPPAYPLATIACGSASSCYVVRAGGTPVTVARWNGTSWANLSPLDGYIPPQMKGVSCSGVDECMVVGFYYDMQKGRLAPLARRWNGISWTESKPPESATSRATLAEVSCPSSARCMAVGGLDGAALAEEWNGTTWTQRTFPLPAGATGGAPSAISCTSATACVAVGSYGDAVGDRQPLLVTWDGTSWTIQPITTPPGASQFQLNDVSCDSATACTAVGRSDVTGGEAPFAVRWNGTTATAQSPPQQGGTTDTFFQGVSCPAANLCLAAGRQGLGGPTAWQRWNGTAWTTLPTPASYNLTDIYCTTPEICRVIGSSYNVYEWNGTTWANQSTLNPPGAPGNLAVQGLSCLGLNWCMAIGDEYAEKWS